MSISDRLLARSFYKTILGAMRHVLSLRHSCLLAKYIIVLLPVTFRHIFSIMFTAWYDIGPCVLLARNPNGFIAIRINRCLLKGFKPLDLGRSPYPIIFNLHGGHKVTPLFMGYVMIFLMFILQSILHGCGDSVLSPNLNNVFVKCFVVYGPISCL